MVYNATVSEAEDWYCSMNFERIGASCEDPEEPEVVAA